MLVEGLFRVCLNFIDINLGSYRVREDVKEEEVVLEGGGRVFVFRFFGGRDG